MNRIATRAMVLLLLLAGLPGCSREAGWRLHTLPPLIPDLAFTLTDDAGQLRHAHDYRGHTTLLYFGFTSCADVCPTTLARLRTAIRSLPANAPPPRVLFVTVDPARDNLARLHRYVSAFGSEFIGLRGTAAQLEALARRYRVAYSHGTPDTHGNYSVTHSSAVFVFDGAGHARLLALPGDPAADIAADLGRLQAS